MEDHWISIADASKILALSDRQVRRYCNDEKLQSRKDGTAYEVTLQSVLELRGTQSDETSDTDADEPATIILEPNEQQLADTDTQLTGNGSAKADTHVQVSGSYAPDEHVQTIISNTKATVADATGKVSEMAKLLLAERNRNQQLQQELADILRTLQIPVEQHVMADMTKGVRIDQLRPRTLLIAGILIILLLGTGYILL